MLGRDVGNEKAPEPSSATWHFDGRYKDDGNIDQFYSKLAIEDANTQKELYSDEIFVNKPLRYGGATIYQADWAIDRLQMFINGFPVVVPCKSLPADGGDRSWAAFLPLELVTAKDPAAVKQITKPKEGIVFIVQNMRNVQAKLSELFTTTALSR
eukprot:g9063.t1